MEVTATLSKSRLLKLADLLQDLPRNRFNYGQWVGEDWKGKPNLSCGTTACALGWATTITSLRRAGLRLVRVDKTGYGGSGGYVALFRNGERMATSELAASLVFGLTIEEAGYLFHGDHPAPYELRDKLTTSPGWGATPKQVAKHIKRFVKVKFPND